MTVDACGQLATLSRHRWYTEETNSSAIATTQDFVLAVAGDRRLAIEGSALIWALGETACR